MNVWTCSANLLSFLADRVLAGFPVEGENVPLEDWTILLPNRRAKRALETMLYQRCGRRGLVLPSISPIGDADEDLLLSQFPQDLLPDAMTDEEQMFLMLGLVGDWAAANPHVDLAQDVASSPSQALGLAGSLSDLFTELETEEASIANLSAFQDLDLAEHRDAISGLLGLVQERLPQVLQKLGKISAASRRNHLIRLKAAFLKTRTGPIIVAGSTGSLPATRHLLKAVAEMPRGAVILPGLDLQLDEEAWNAIGPVHPQYTMKLLLAELDVKRNAVHELSGVRPPQDRLVREIMRPAAASEAWALLAGDATLLQARPRLVEAPDRHKEARSIAILIRETLEQKGKSAALVTPDRDLALRVKAELSRWNIEADDSGGRPLAAAGHALLFHLLTRLVTEKFSAGHLIAMLAHPDCKMGCHTARLFEIVCLRTDLPLAQPSAFVVAYGALRKQMLSNSHSHPVAAAMSDADWQALDSFVAALAEVLMPLESEAVLPLAEHLLVLRQALATLAGAKDEADGEQIQLEDLFVRLAEASRHHPPCTLKHTVLSITWALSREVARAPLWDDSHVAIYGLPEARMMAADLLILGGLNEGIWPAAVDPGPWVSRSMRTALVLKQPERDIGITAHDFAQGLMHSNVVVTWARRIASVPRVPSRWVLRLQAILRLAGLGMTEQLEKDPLMLADALDAAEPAPPLQPPRPKPPLAVRPRKFRVTEIRLLRRDPYAIYARHVLKLLPLPPVGATPDHRLRGTVFHNAIGAWLQAGTFTVEALVEQGERVLHPFMSSPEVRNFWWPRFRRIATALAGEEQALQVNCTRSHVEQQGVHAFRAADVDHAITARADRIDVLANGTLRLIDYKTGQLPTEKQVESGLEPQLTLEAALAQAGSFSGLAPASVSALLYVRISGLNPPVKVEERLDGASIAAVAASHLAGLQTLLAAYQDPSNAYNPRLALFKDKETSDYDHLSRYREWSGGGA